MSKLKDNKLHELIIKRYTSQLIELDWMGKKNDTLYPVTISFNISKIHLLRKSDRYNRCLLLEGLFYSGGYPVVFTQQLQTLINVSIMKELEKYFNISDMLVSSKLTHSKEPLINA